MISVAAHPRLFGEWQAYRRAGPWPRSGTLEAFSIATDRAVREARRASNLEYRWCRRFRLWECQDERVERQSIRLLARRELAIEIAEERKYLMRRLVDEMPRGTA